MIRSLSLRRSSRIRTVLTTLNAELDQRLISHTVMTRGVDRAAAAKIVESEVNRRVRALLGYGRD